MKKLYFTSLLSLLVLVAFLMTSCSLGFPAVGNGDSTVDQGASEDTPSDNVGGDASDDNASVDDGGSEDSGDDSDLEDNTNDDSNQTAELEIPAISREAFDLSSLPAYDTVSYIEINNNVPSFTQNQLTTEAYEYYGELDSLGRCTIAVACLGKELMPEEGTNRGSLSSVSPTAWHGNGIYERSHLIAFSLAGETTNKQNLITATYDLNGVMQIFENYVRDYIKETENHVMYRVEPIFEGENLLCSGVHYEAYSVEDEGEGISYNIYIYNAQDDVVIDYASGDYEIPESEYTYIVNLSKYKIHKTTCSAVHDMSESNKMGTTLTLEELIEWLESEGHTTWSYCGLCKPQSD